MPPLAAKNRSQDQDQGTSTAMEDHSTTPLLGNKSVGGHSLSQRPGHAASTTAQHHLESSSITLEPKDDMEFKDLSRKSQWIALAVMSGACAAFNGVFAKLYFTLFFPHHYLSFSFVVASL